MRGFWTWLFGAVTAIVVILVIGYFVVGKGSDQPRPPSIAACAYPSIKLEMGPRLPEAGLLRASAPVPGSFAAAVADIVAKKAASRPPQGGASGENATPAPAELAVLSGGSQHGAFGAGFFYGLQAIPRYDVVTGISTGSLQSTMVFLANNPVPKDRKYDWVDGPLASIVKPGVSSAGDLALAYSIAKETDIATPQAGGILGGLSKGSLATFGPLKARLKALITPETLRQIKAEAAAGRKLFVGVVNLDDGNAYAIDQTALASRVDTPDWKDKTGTLQDCFIDALVASSSVPPGAMPVSLTLAMANGPQTNLYMDGGAAFGVFLDQLGSALGQVGKDAKVTVIDNGALYAPAWTENNQPVQKWSALSVSQRAVSLLETQVYRFSVASAERFGLEHGGFSLAFISNQGIPGGEDPNNHVFNGKTCAQWNTIDNQAKVMEFHPNYMSCLVDYGRTRGAAGQWNLVVNNPGAAAS